MPVAAPTAVVLPVRTASRAVHTTSAAAGARNVLANASAAVALAASALPALKPNQPTHSRPAPRSTNGTWCGSIACRPQSLRGPTTSAATSAAAAALTWTTVPPAKSSAPRRKIQPSASHTQCATGAYTATLHSVTKARYGPKRIRSATAPEISAAVMTTNVAW